ncbi:GNAT family N-acetyltransferase [Bacillus sp. T33-2]|uniref:GNAT family N-acetyltransferase n=1 Tax=Bacillus sp. T33-2 TaxID=2054168 RepID=UPI002155F675|nr:GNAT family protein [Bacillus sp. T33-2]
MILDRLFRFAVRMKETNGLIGFAEVDVNLWTHRTGWVAIGIGEESAHGKGLAEEAMVCLLNHCFHELNLHRVQLTVFSYNIAAINLYEKLGFKKEGTYREFTERNGRRHNMYLYGMLRPEWKS